MASRYTGIQATNSSWRCTAPSQLLQPLVQGQRETHATPEAILRLALEYLGACAMLTSVGLTLSVSGGWFAWTCGQILLGCAFLQWFVLLHEAGHHTLFRSTVFNHGVGHIASFFALIPFECWKLVHARHHVWTGWQDLDATTAALVPRALHPAERRLVNLCWKLWIPLFSVLYGATNFWNLARLHAFFPHPTQRRCLARGVVLQGAAYLVTFYTLGIAELVNATGLALLLCLMLQDPLLLSQHTHIPQNLSRGRVSTRCTGDVYPIAAVSRLVFRLDLALRRPRAASHVPTRTGLPAAANRLS